MPMLCPQAPDAMEICSDRLPPLHSTEGLQLLESLRNAFKHSLSYNRESIENAENFRKLNVKIFPVETTKSRRIKATYRFVGKTDAPGFPVED